MTICQQLRTNQPAWIAAAAVVLGLGLAAPPPRHSRMAH